MEKMLEESDNKEIDLNVEPESCVPCSICLDLVIYGGERSRAKLQCGHEFHLDCIGSAFNMKGTMQCPNCRKIEKGQWLYANGSTNSSLELSMDDGGTDNYPFYFGFTEMVTADSSLCTCFAEPYRVHICPFRGFSQVHPAPESSLGMMNAMTPMVNHQHPGGNGPHPHGWLQFHHTPFPHHPLASGLPMPIGNAAGRFDTQRSLPRFISPGRVYDPNGGFSPYGESPVNYSHSWVSDNNPHFPLQ
ncbi:hypothetical protein KSS87_023817 [Heliosperma pusillum]|nr:hypothetical protein KSS87_023817 [Heliosperma pusillum]